MSPAALNHSVSKLNGDTARATSTGTARKQSQSREEKRTSAEIRRERQRAKDAGCDDLLNDEDITELAACRKHWANELGGLDRVTLLVMIEGAMGSTHALLDRVIVLPEGGVHRVLRDVVAYSDRIDPFCETGTQEVGAGGSAEVGIGGELPREVVESIESFRGTLLSRALGGRQPILISAAVPNYEKDLLDFDLVKMVAISAAPDAMESACAGVLALARSIDPAATLSEDVQRP